MLRRVALVVFTLLIANQLWAQADYSEQDFKRDWSAPLYNKSSQKILLWGSVLTFGLVATRENTIAPTQEYFEKHEPLGDFSKYGDYAGQTIPNLLYMGSMYYAGDPTSLKRSQYMFKTTFFSGITVFFLKRIINQKRPDGGDRNSHPSGHAATAFAFAGVISHEHPHWGIPAYTLASFVALSRMNDNVHYLHDVVMGASIGIAYAYAFRRSDNSVAIYPLWSQEKSGLVVRYDF